jgi:hypothetical protein
MHQRSSLFRRLAATAVTACGPALLLVGTIAVTSARAQAAHRAGDPTCSPSTLVVWLDTQGNGAAGSIFYKLEFTNLSSRSCSLFGYPGVSAVDLAGRQLGSAAGRDFSRTPHTVTLRTGATAGAMLRIVDVGGFSASSCHRVFAAGLRVYPPNGTSSKVVPFPFAACTSTASVYLYVQSVQRA